MPDQLEEAIIAIKSGDKATAKRLLIQILEADPHNESAWLWLTKAIQERQARIKCLQNVLKINPKNELAQRGLANLQKKGKPSARPAKGSQARKRWGLPLLLLGGLLLCFGLLGVAFLGGQSLFKSLSSESEAVQAPAGTPAPAGSSTAAPVEQAEVNVPPEESENNQAAPEAEPAKLREAVAEPVWHWGDINLAPGSRGILITDWDGDGKNELFVAHNAFIFAIQHSGEYEFSQNWSVPAGLDWGLDDIMGDQAKELWVLQPDGTLLSYTGYDYEAQTIGQLEFSDQLQTDRRFPAVRAQVVDLAGDGQKELLVLGSSSEGLALYTYSLPDLAETWQYALNLGSDEPWAFGFQIGQVDDDPAQEIVLASGVVVDPANSVEQWAYNDGFGHTLQLADIDDDGREEIIGANRSLITAYDVDLESPKWQFEARTEKLYLADVAEDETPEIIVGTDQEVNVYDAESQQLLWSVENPRPGVSGLGVGDIDNDGEQDLVWGAGSGSTGPDELYLTPISRRSPTFTFSDYDGPYRAIAMQLDDDDTLETIIFTYGTNSGDGGTYFILDSATGALEPELALEIEAASSWDEDFYNPLLANTDGDPEFELVLGIEQNLYLLDHDGSRLVKREVSASVRPEWVGDVDGDGLLELVSSSNSQVNIHSLDSLEYEWQSIIFETGVQDVAVADVDQDQHLELVFFGRESYLQAYDGQTHQLDWQMSQEQQIQGLAIGNIDNSGPLEIVAIDNGLLTFYNALTHEPLESHSAAWISESSTLHLSYLMATPHPQLIVASREQALIFYHPYDPQPAQTLPIESPFITWADMDNDQYMDLLVGDRLGITRYRMRETFPDITPPTARGLLPAAEADLISRNAFAQVSFNEGLDPASLVETNAQLQVDGSPVSTELSYDSESRTLTLKPQELLPDNSLITVWLGPGLVDLAGNGLDANLNGVGGETEDSYSWKFKTGSGVDEVGPVIEEIVLSPDPAWAGMQVMVTAQVDDTNPAGASSIRQVRYFLDTPGSAETGILLVPEDEQFDERQETVSGRIDTSDWQEDRLLYLQAEDSVGNWGAPVEVTLHLQPESPANWSTFGSDPAHTGYNSAQAGVSGYAPVWEQNLFELFGGGGRSLDQVAVANGLVVANTIAGSSQGGIIAFNSEDGQELWRYEPAERNSIHPATIAYGNVYFQQESQRDDSYLVALNALTGEQLWQSPYSVQWDEHCAPTVADGKVFIQAGHYGGMYAYDAVEGYELWSVGLAQVDKWAPSYDQGVVYSWVEGAFAAWDPAYGTQLWSLKLGERHSKNQAATISGDTAYVVSAARSGQGSLVAIDLPGQAEKWRVEGSFVGNPAVAEGEIYALNGQTLQVYEKSGELLWSYEAGADLIGAPLVTGGDVYIASAGHTWVISRADQAVVWEVDKGGWLTVANDQLFIAQPEGVLAVYKAQ